MRYSSIMMAGAAALVCTAGGVYARPTDKPGETRSAEAVIDRFEIMELMDRYGVVHDFGTPQEYADLFTADAEIVAGNGNVIIKGREALIASAERDHERFAEKGANGTSSSIMRHLITNKSVNLTGSTAASGTSYVATIVRKGDIGPEILSVGRYEDRFVKQGCEWRIAKRKIVMDFGNRELGKKLGF